MQIERYNQLTVKHGDDSFTIYCTQVSLETRRDEVIMWVDSLARRLDWLDYEMIIDAATEASATARPHALFENRFPPP